MTIRATKPIGILAAASVETHVGEVDAFILRNRDELNASIQRSRQDVKMGGMSARTVGDIIADGRKRHGAA